MFVYSLFSLSISLSKLKAHFRLKALIHVCWWQNKATNITIAATVHSSSRLLPVWVAVTVLKKLTCLPAFPHLFTLIFILLCFATVWSVLFKCNICYSPTKLSTACVITKCTFLFYTALSSNHDGSLRAGLPWGELIKLPFQLIVLNKRFTLISWRHLVDSCACAVVRFKIKSFYYLIFFYH